MDDVTNRLSLKGSGKQGKTSVAKTAAKRGGFSGDRVDAARAVLRLAKKYDAMKIVNAVIEQWAEEQVEVAARAQGPRGGGRQPAPSPRAAQRRREEKICRVHPLTRWWTGLNGELICALCHPELTAISAEDAQ